GIDALDVSEQPEVIAQLFGNLDERAQILGETTAAKSQSGVEKAAPNARVHANAVCHFLHVGARGFAHQRNRVDVGNLQREKRIGRVLDQLGGMDVGDDDGRVIRCKDFLDRLNGTL